MSDFSPPPPPPPPGGNNTPKLPESESVATPPQAPEPTSIPNAQPSIGGYAPMGQQTQQFGAPQAAQQTGQYGYIPQQGETGQYGYVPQQGETGSYQGIPVQQRGPSFFKALLDLEFKDFITIKFAKFLYIIVIILSLLGWIGTAVTLLIAGTNASGLLILGVLHLLFGWILALLQIIVYRVILEFFIAQIRTAQNTTQLVAAQK